MNDLNLSVLWDHPDFPVDYTYCSIANDTASFSTIDHFAISPMLEKVVIEAGVASSALGGKTLPTMNRFISKLKLRRSIFSLIKKKE